MYDAREQAILTEHLGYSRDLIARAVAEISAPPHQDHDREWFRQMSIFEVFWMQARLLEEFFRNDPAPAPSWATAIRFTQGHVPYDIPRTRKFAPTMNDQIAHMNYARTMEAEEKLQLDEMLRVAGELKRAFAAFEKSLTPDARKLWEGRGTGRYEIDVAAANSRDADEPIVVNSTTSATFAITRLFQDRNENESGDR